MNQSEKPGKVFHAFFFILFCLFFILSCGIDEHYYLPQVPESNITRTNNTEARVILPQIDNYYYATSYSIYYRIYISNYPAEGEIISLAERRNISPSLVSDFDTFSSFTNPTSTSLPASNTFSNRDYFELEFDGEETSSILSIGGSTLNFIFPTWSGCVPAVVLNNGREIPLCRSGNLISPEPSGNPFFRNASGLSDYNFSTQDNKNKDVAGRYGMSEHAYVSMYIVAVGYNNTDFNYIYSKPTFISIFKLPNM